MLFETKKEAWARNRAAERWAMAVDAVLVPGQIYLLPSGSLARYRFLSKKHTLEFVLVDPVTCESLRHGALSMSAAYAEKVKLWSNGGAS